MEMMEYRMIALKNEGAMECYLEEKIQGTTIKQNADATLVSFEMHAEAVDQLVSLPVESSSTTSL